MRYDVTIGIPVYRSVDFIRRSIESALNQTYDSIEFLIVDDKGDDGSMNVVRQIQASHPKGEHIHVIFHKSNLGVSASRNDIIEKAQGDYLYFMDSDDVIAENYLRSSRFKASGYDGFMQEYVEMDPDRLIKIPKSIDNEVAAFTEIISVSVHAIDRMDRFAHKRRNVVGIWGDGNIGYITAVLFKTIYPNIKLYVFGIDEKKLSDFDFVDGIFKTDSIPNDIRVDHAFECVGNKQSGDAINQIIDYINPEGTISILGVSEEPVPINTRMVLEKGLRIFGSSRSGYDDFYKTVSLMEENPEIVKRLKTIVGEVIEVNNIEDAKNAFARDSARGFGKTIMKWNI